MTSVPPSTSGPCLERVLFALAGTVVLTAVILSVLVSPWFLLLAVFAAANQWLYATVRFCPAAVVLRRVTGLSTGCRR